MLIVSSRPRAPNLAQAGILVLRTTAAVTVSKPAGCLLLHRLFLGGKLLGGLLDDRLLSFLGRHDYFLPAFFFTAFLTTFFAGFFLVALLMLFLFADVYLLFARSRIRDS